MAATFPTGQLDNLGYLAETVGSFWPELYGGKDLVLDYLRGCNALERQVQQLIAELTDAAGRQSCPTYHTDLWRPLEIHEEASRPANPLTFGTDLDFGEQAADGHVWFYGDAFDAAVEFPVDTALADAAGLTDQVVNPGVYLSPGLDFRIDQIRGTLIFAANPFHDSRFTPTGVPGSRTLTVYLFQAQLDWQYVPTIWGSPVGVTGDSTPQKTKLVNAIWDGLTAGCSRETVLDVLEAVTAVPRARNRETVLQLTTDYAGQLVITDQAVYRLPAAATLTVTVGDALTPGQQLSNAVQVYELVAGLPADLQGQGFALTLPAALFPPTVGSDLTFTDVEVPLVVQENVTGYTRVSFTVGGAGAAAFFDELHARGVAAGKTLANYLDVRVDPADQPGPASLPATINPLRFVIENVLRFNTSLVVIRPTLLSSDALDLGYTALLRRVVPPGSGVLVAVV